MELIAKYWFVAIIILAAGVIIWYAIHEFNKLPLSERWKKVSAWLLQAVIMAEKELGSKTGQAKLSYVYDMFITKFKFVSTFMTFETFGKLVDEVLEKFKNMVADNAELQKYIIDQATHYIVK